MVHKQEGADKLHNSDMCGIQWDMSPDGHWGPPKVPCYAGPEQRWPDSQTAPDNNPSNGRQVSMPRLQGNDKYHFKNGPIDTVA